MKIISVYSTLNSRENYVTLLEGLEHLTTALRTELWQRQQRQKKGDNEIRFNHGSANVRPQPFPNVATRSRRAAAIADISSLTLSSQLRPGLFLSEEDKPSSISNQKPTATEHPDIANKQSEPALINHENGTLIVEARPATTDIGISARDKLKQAVERCKETYLKRSFIVNGDEHSETVLPDEIDDFFSCFEEGKWLASSNLMPLLFSFRWPSTTLVLHSSYTSFTALKSDVQNPSTRVRWPIHRKHDRIILPCCSQSHWTLYDIDLTCNFIRHYNSLNNDASKLEETVSAIKERLAYATERWESPKRDFTIVSGVSEKSYLRISPFCER